MVPRPNLKGIAEIMFGGSFCLRGFLGPQLQCISVLVWVPQAYPASSMWKQGFNAAISACQKAGLGRQLSPSLSGGLRGPAEFYGFLFSVVGV